MKASTETGMNWDLTSYFPEFNGPEMIKFKTSLQSDMASLKEKSSGLRPLDDRNQDEWEAVFLMSEDILKRVSHLSSYVGCLSAADARNEAYLRAESEMASMEAELSKLTIQLIRAIKEVPDEVFSRFIGRVAFEGARYALGRLREESIRTMAPEMEELAAELGVDGINAWGRIYDNISGKLEFEMEFPDGTSKRLPISQRRSLMENPDRRVRRAAFVGGNAAWETVEDVAAAALNAISGTRLTLQRRRGVEHFMETALFQAAIKPRTLGAMFEAIFAEPELPRRILRLKAGMMDSKAVSWYDLGAPLPLPDQEPVSWEKGKALVLTAFQKAHPALGEFIQMMFDRNWIEWEPRAGKRPGGFCTSSLLIGESRIFMTFNGTLGDVMTLAHEAGHAFHSYVMRTLRPFESQCPMTLAESASTIGEMILIEGITGEPSINDEQKAMILDVSVGHGAIYLMDIPVRYQFEKVLYGERSKGEISVSRIKEMMVETQRRIFGDLLENGGEDPYFWASKLHFYITGLMFYNFPYTFGYLLSRGLFAEFKKKGPEFLPEFEAFLRLSGSESPEDVARETIGCNLESPEFWTDAIKTLEMPLQRLEELLPKVLP